MAEPIFFYIFGGLAVLMITLMIFQSNPVASALCLVFALFCLAGLYVLLQAPFVAVLQVLIYAGAVMVLFVFVIMLLKLRRQDLEEDRITGSKILVVLVGFAFSVFLSLKFLSIQIGPFPELSPHFGEAEPVGRILLTQYLIPFELVSILLLVGIVGVVVLGKKEE